MKRNVNNHYSNMQLFWLVSLRVLIGWYFLYEGLAKVFSPKWTAYGYLMDSKGFFAPLFNMIADNPDLMAIADFINIWGLTLIGLLLILGLFEKVGYVGAILLLALYYLSHPPLLNVEYILRPEGSYLWVDKNLIMLAATIVLFYFPTSKKIGLDRIMDKKRKLQ